MTHLQQVRGFAPSTVTYHDRTASEFLAHIGYETHPPRLAALDRRDLDAFLCAVGPRQSRASLQHVVGHLRAFLRFLAPDGEIPTGLDAQIDTPRVYRGEKPPAGAALGHGSGAPALDRSLDPAWASRLRDLPPHGDLRPARVRGRDAHARRRGVAGGAAAHPATQDTPLALAAAHRRGRYRAARLPPPRTPCPERAPAARPVSRRGPPRSYRELFLRCRTPAGVLKRRRSPRPSRPGRSEAASPFRSRAPIARGTRTRCTSCGRVCRSRRSGTSWAIAPWRARACISAWRLTTSATSRCRCRPRSTAVRRGWRHDDVQLRLVSLLKCVWVAAAPVLCLHSRGTASRSTRRASGSHRRDARSPAACC